MTVRHSQGGSTFVETSLVLAVIGLLSGLGVASLDLERHRLVVLKQELQGSLDQALVLARARGADVTVALGERGGQDPTLLPVPLPRGVAWGRPAHIPLPPGMTAAPIASATGSSHRRITVTPRRTVTAGAWFFTDGRDALCLRLSGKARLTTLRYRAREGRWRLDS